MRKLSFVLALAMILPILLLCPTGVSAAEGDEYVAEINGTKYSNLTSASISLGAGETMNLLANVKGNLIISKNATVNGNGYTLSGTFTASSASVTVRDLNVSSDSDTALTATSGATLSVSGGCYSSTGNRATVSVGSDSTVNIYSGVFVNNGTGSNLTASSGTKNTVNIYGGSFTVTDSDFCVSITDNAGADGTLNVYGGYFCNPRTDDRDECYGVSGRANMYGGYQSHMGTVNGSAGNSYITDPKGLYSNAAGKGLPYVYSASVRLRPTDPGLRFTSVATAQTVEYVLSIEGVDPESMGFGTVIAPTDVLALGKNVPMTAETLEIYGQAYADLPAKYGLEYDDKGNVFFRTALTNIKEKNLNRQFTAIPYISFTVNGEPVRIYGLADPKDAKSIVETATATLEDGNYEGISESILLTYASKNTVLDGIPLSNYSIVYPKDHTLAELDFAKKLQEMIYDLSGLMLPLRDDEKESEHEILVGNTARSVSACAAKEYRITANGKRIEIRAGVYLGYMYAAEELSLSLLDVLRRETEDGKLLVCDITARARAEENYRLIKKDTDMRILFHNVWGTNDAVASLGYPTQSSEAEARIKLLAEVYAAYDPDVLCLQEYTEDVMRTTSLISLMEEMGYAELEVTNSSLTYTTASPIFYKKDKMQVLECGTYNLEGRNNKCQFVTWAVFKTVPDKHGEEHVFAVLSVDLAEESNQVGNYKRLMHVEQIYGETVSYVSEKYNCTVVVGGSFNCTPDSEPYRKLTNLGMTPVYGLAYTSENSSGSMGYPKYDAESGRTYRDPVSRGTYANATDHVFTVRESEETVFNVYDYLTDTFASSGSDHAPVMVEFWFPYDQEWTDPF